MGRYDPCHSRNLNCSLRYQEGILIYGTSALEQVFLYFLYGEHNLCPGWSEANKSLRTESPERKDIMAENIYMIPGLISHVSSEVMQSLSQLRPAVTFPDID